MRSRSAIYIAVMHAMDGSGLAQSVVLFGQTGLLFDENGPVSPPISLTIPYFGKGLYYNCEDMHIPQVCHGSFDTSQLCRFYYIA